MRHMPGNKILFRTCLACPALGLSISLLASSCSSSCQRADSKIVQNEPISQEPILEEAPLASLLFDGCTAKEATETPILYAHFGPNSTNPEPNLKALAQRDKSHFICAPGPFLASNQVDEEKSWALNRMPNYFIWLIGNTSLEQEQFYLTNQNGLPVKSTTITVGSGNSRTVILHPQVMLNKSDRYYIYQVLTKGESRTTWVQPVISSQALSLN